MSALAESFKAALEGSSIRNERTIVAVSGGIDSTTLLHVVCSVREHLRLDIHVAHVDHGLRQDSHTDAAFVQRLAQHYKVPFHSTRVDVHDYARAKGCGIEAAARHLRYDFLTGIAIDINARTVLTAHTADDQVETVLMSIARGGSIAALAGIPRQRRLTEGVRVLRPLLDFSRSDVEKFARSERLEWVEDASNLERVFLRNRVRHELIPQLKAVLGPGIGRNLIRMAQTMGRLNEIVNELASDAESRLVRQFDGTYHLDLDHLRSLRPVIIEAVLRRYLPHLGAADRDRLHELVASEVGSQATFSGGWQALRERRYIEVRKGLTWPEPAGVLEIVLDDVHQLLTFPIGEQILELRYAEMPLTPKKQPRASSIAVDLEVIVGTLWCRPWQSGDRIHLDGVSGPKLVSDVLTDAKIPHAVRKNIFVLGDDGGILWICGLRQSRRAVVTDATIRCLLCSVVPDLLFDRP